MNFVPFCFEILQLEFEDRLSPLISETETARRLINGVFEFPNLNIGKT